MITNPLYVTEWTLDSPIQIIVLLLSVRAEQWKENDSAMPDQTDEQFLINSTRSYNLTYILGFPLKFNIT